MIGEEILSSCIVLIHVVPHLLFTVTPFPATPTNNLAVPSPSLGICHCNKRDMRNSREQNFTIVFAPIPSISTGPTYYRGNSRYCFPKRCNWQICHAHRAFRLPLCTFRGKLQTFLPVKSKTIGYLLHRTQKYTPVPFWRILCELLPEKELPSGHYVRNSTKNALKIAGSALQNDF